MKITFILGFIALLILTFYVVTGSEILAWVLICAIGVPVTLIVVLLAVYTCVYVGVFSTIAVLTLISRPSKEIRRYR